MKHGPEHTYTVSDDKLDAVAGGLRIPKFQCEKCQQSFFSRDNRMYFLLPKYGTLCENCYNEEMALEQSTDATL